LKLFNLSYVGEKRKKVVRLKDSEAHVAKTGATAATRSEANADVNETITNKLLNLSPKKSVKTKKNKIVVDDYVDNKTQQHILNIAKKVTYLEEENKATQRAVAKLRQLVSISVQFHKDELVRDRERSF
jgi:hypothetical protein